MNREFGPHIPDNEIVNISKAYMECHTLVRFKFIDNGFHGKNDEWIIERYVNSGIISGLIYRENYFTEIDGVIFLITSAIPLINGEQRDLVEVLLQKNWKDEMDRTTTLEHLAGRGWKPCLS